MDRNFFNQFWAKSDGVTTLEMHTNHVITAGNNLIQNLPLSSEEKERIAGKLFRCAVLHDLGKIHSTFQDRLLGKGTTSIRHEIISLWFCENFLELNEDELFAIATHHKGIIHQGEDKGRLEGIVLTSNMEFHLESDSDLLTKETLIAWLDLLELKIDIVDKEKQFQISKQTQKILRYGYQEKVLPKSTDRKELSLMRALLIASDHIGSARMENRLPEYKKIELRDFQPKKEAVYFEFRSFQEKLQGIKSDIILHAPTGSGKTEAALSWVFANQVENARLFYLLPYTASINAMVKRLQTVFGEDKVTALHSKTLDFFYEQLAEEESNYEKDYGKIEAEARSKKTLSAELFYPVKVATLHQILKTSLKGKGWELALYDYKNALFIIDEFHTYDSLLTGLMLASIKLFKKLFNGKFLFMSATIPDFMLKIILKEIFDNDESKLIRPDPKWESDRLILDKKRHQLYCQFNSTIDDKIYLIKKYLKEGRSVLIIVNNVKTAQKLYQGIEFKGSVNLLHSGFNKSDRNIIEGLITNRDISKRPNLLIATQAVEVSLDIDYDIAFIENAPIDALIQRFGRINRAGGKQIFPLDRDENLLYDTVPVYLFENIIGKTPFYEMEVLLNTWNELSKHNESELSEHDLINVCNKVYENGYNENQQKDFEQGLNNSIIKSFEDDWIAGNWNNWIEDVIENNNQKVEVLCFNLIDDFDEKKRNKQYIEANQLLVQVYRYELGKYEPDKKRNVIVANNLVYNPIIGYTKKDDSFEDRSF